MRFFPLKKMRGRLACDAVSIRYRYISTHSGEKNVSLALAEIPRDLAKTGLARKIIRVKGVSLALAEIPRDLAKQVWREK